MRAGRKGRARGASGGRDARAGQAAGPVRPVPSVPYAAPGQPYGPHPEAPLPSSYLPGYRPEPVTPAITTRPPRRRGRVVAWVAAAALVVAGGAFWAGTWVTSHDGGAARVAATAGAAGGATVPATSGTAGAADSTEPGAGPVTQETADGGSQDQAVLPPNDTAPTATTVPQPVNGYGNRRVGTAQIGFIDLPVGWTTLYSGRRGTGGLVESAYTGDAATVVFGSYPAAKVSGADVRNVFAASFMAGAVGDGHYTLDTGVIGYSANVAAVSATSDAANGDETHAAFFLKDSLIVFLAWTGPSSTQVTDDFSYEVISDSYKGDS